MSEGKLFLIIILAILIIDSCEKNADYPTVITTSAESISATSAIIGGVVLSDGGARVTKHGVYWGISEIPESSGNKLPVGTDAEVFSITLEGLTALETYYYKAYAINSVGEATGNLESFTTQYGSGVFTDIRDGHEYKWVTIGEQTWMAENLNATQYADGTTIPLVEEASAWSLLGTTAKAYCYYDNNDSIGNIYGALYTWAAAMNGEAGSNANPGTVQGVCPTGWHMPSDEEWKELEMFLGMSQAEADKEDHRGTSEGDKLKEAGTTHWASSNTGTNTSGFTALPGGGRDIQGSYSFWRLGDVTFFWTSSEKDYRAWIRYLGYNGTTVARTAFFEDVGLSVRCIKNK